MTDTTAQIFALLIGLALISALIDEEKFFDMVRAMHRDPEKKALIARAIRPHFQLLRYFTTVGLIMIGLVALTLVYFESRQIEQIRAREEQLVKEHASTVTHTDLLSKAFVQNTLEQLTAENAQRISRLLLNAIGTKPLGALFERAQQMPAPACPTPAEGAPASCQEAWATQLRELPGQKLIVAQLQDLLTDTEITGLRLIDTRGMTLLSTAPEQLGENLSAVTEFAHALETGKPVNKIAPAVTSQTAPARQNQTTWLRFDMPQLGKFVIALNSISPAAPPAFNLAPAIPITDTQTVASIERSSLFLLASVAGVMVVFFAVLFMLVRRADILNKKNEEALTETEARLEQTTLIASAKKFDPALADELIGQLRTVWGRIDAVRAELLSATETQRIAAALLKLIRNTPTPQVTLNIDTAKAHLAASQGELDVRKASLELEAAQKKIAQMVEVLDSE